MPPQLYRTGAVNLFVGVGNAAQGSAQSLCAYLGTCEEYPQIEIKPLWKNLTSDESGDSADDVAFMGEEALVFADVNRFDENVYAKLAARPFHARGSASGTPRGSWPRRAVGALMKRNNLTYQLWLQFPNAALPSMGGSVALPFFGNLGRLSDVSPMPAGYRFPDAYLVGPDKLAPLGTQARKVQLIWHCISRKLPRGQAGGTLIPGTPSVAASPSASASTFFGKFVRPGSPGAAGTPDRFVPDPAQERFLLYDHDMSATQVVEVR